MYKLVMQKKTDMMTRLFAQLTNVQVFSSGGSLIHQQTNLITIGSSIHHVWRSMNFLAIHTYEHSGFNVSAFVFDHKGQVGIICLTSADQYSLIR